MMNTRESDWLPTDPEVQSVEALVENLMEEGAETFTAQELQLLNGNLRRPVHEIRKELEGYGFSIAPRPKPFQGRGYTRGIGNDRWYGPGSAPCHGGSGYEQIAGFAGRQG